MVVSVKTTSVEAKVHHSVRKWSGVIWFLIEVNLIGGTIFGFPALFKILPQYGIYNDTNNCAIPLINRTEAEGKDSSCEGHQTRQYQNALTLGIILFEIPSVIIGPLIDRFGCRFVKLIAIIFHIIGWLALAFVAPGRDSLLYVHTNFSSLAGIIVLLTAYTSSDYFSKSRAFVSALFAGACTSATMWYSIFQILNDADKITLQQLSYIWMSFSVLMLISSFLYLDCRFPILNLPYRFDTKFEKKQDHSVIITGEDQSSNGSEIDNMKCFPSEYIGTLTGVMWTAVGVITTVQYVLVQLTNNVSLSWRAWLIVLSLVILMSCHLVQLWWKYVKEFRKKSVAIMKK
ncbi:unnamed protein product [Rotaria sp. Silwood2]|nr:unnamed protein product [Rotaria sp. Silwood2]CAF4113274.1 unnamed protein product [Rotaria sp. Silwood2]